MTTPAFIVELPVRDGDDVSRFLKPKCSFGTQVYNAMLDTALGRFQRLKESKAWHDAFVLSECPRRRNATGNSRGFARKQDSRNTDSLPSPTITATRQTLHPRDDVRREGKVQDRRLSALEGQRANAIIMEAFGTGGCLEQAFDEGVFPP